MRRISALSRVYVANVETGVSGVSADSPMRCRLRGIRQYLWLTDLGLKSQWLDMTSYDHVENFGLYFAVLKKGEPTPLLPESDEETGQPAAGDGAGGRQGGAARQAPPVNVTIDFDGIQRRVISVPSVAAAEFSQLKSGVAGSVYYLQAGALKRYRLSDRRATDFVAGVADFDLSADGHKLLYRAAGGGGRGRGAGAGAAADAGPALFIVDADRTPPAAGAGRLTTNLQMYLEPKAEFAQIFNEGWRNQRDYLYVPNAHGSNWFQMKEMYGDLLQYVNHRADLNYLLDNMGAEIAIGHSYVRGGDLPDVPSSNGGLLGADFIVETGRYNITRIYDNESCNHDLSAPLD